MGSPAEMVLAFFRGSWWSTSQIPLQLEEMRKNEDPRLSFSTPEFKEAQRIFTEGFKV